jgi:hypothetical protein
MTGAELMGVVLFGITVFGTIFGVFKFLDGKFVSLREKLDGVDKDLSDHKLHVAEHYVSKQGHRESTEMLLSAITEVKSAIDGTNQRIDRMFEAKPRRTT